MKRLILIFIPLFLFATPKKRLNDCENEVIRLKTIIEAEKVGSIILTEPPTRKDVKIEKIKSKREIKESRVNANVKVESSKIGLKQAKNDNKTKVKTDKFLNFMQGLTRITALLVVGGSIGGGVLLTKGLQLLKKHPYFSWLPI